MNLIFAKIIWSCQNNRCRFKTLRCLLSFIIVLSLFVCRENNIETHQTIKVFFFKLKIILYFHYNTLFLLQSLCFVVNAGFFFTFSFLIFLHDYRIRRILETLALILYFYIICFVGSELKATRKITRLSRLDKDNDRLVHFFLFFFFHNLQHFLRNRVLFYDFFLLIFLLWYSSFNSRICFFFFWIRLNFFHAPYLQIYIILYCNLYLLMDEYWIISKHINNVCYSISISVWNSFSLIFKKIYIKFIYSKLLMFWYYLS